MRFVTLPLLLLTSQVKLSAKESKDFVCFAHQKASATV
jgi:hypothetical protein